MPPLKRIGGATLIIISIVSLLFSLAALVGVWIVRKPITDTMTAGLALASDTLEVTGYTLGVVDDGLATAGDLVASTQRTVDSLATTLDSTTPALQTVGDLVGTGVPAALDSRQRDHPHRAKERRNRGRRADYSLPVTAAEHRLQP